MRLDNMSGDCQPKTGTLPGGAFLPFSANVAIFYSAGSSLIYLVESLDDPGEVFRRDAHTSIGHTHHYLAIHPCRIERNVPAWWRKFDSVMRQVHQEL